jgi:hypothetical protein
VGCCFHFLNVAHVPKAYRCFAPRSALALVLSGSSNAITVVLLQLELAFFVSWVYLGK